MFGVLQAELVQFPAALVVGDDTSRNRAARAKRAAYQQEILEYQATISECRKQFEAQLRPVPLKWLNQEWGPRQERR